MCFDASKRVIAGRSTLSPTVEMNHPAVSPPLLRAQLREENPSSSAPVDVVRQLAQEQYEINLQRAQQDSQEQHIWDQVFTTKNSSTTHHKSTNDQVERTATIGGGELVREKLQQILLMNHHQKQNTSSSSYSAASHQNNNKQLTSSGINSSGRQVEVEKNNNALSPSTDNIKKQPSPSPKP